MEDAQRMPTIAASYSIYHFPCTHTCAALIKTQPISIPFAYATSLPFASTLSLLHAQDARHIPNSAQACCNTSNNCSL
eukprot:scaffold312523_cov27-Tisochrysis_lutea.AAC.1